jgi:sensitive to high expression protein 9
MDELLSRASIAGQHINEYTGTDYTAIDALRKEISKQEEVVKSCAAACNAARLQQQEAHNDQSNASREIVGLLERKSSWSPVDLERYMALVRSDHINEQAVQAAKDNLTAMEQNLDEARALLERLERKRYHEEQIWSDTIRRNSTWVTFGLMGVNIILLLAQITIFEPYRRKKIAKDVEEMLETRIEDTKSNINEDKLALLLARVLNNDQQNAVAEDEAPGKYKDQPHNVRNDLDPFIAPSPKVEAPIDAELAEKGPRNAEKMPSEQWWSTANLADGLRESRAVISDQFSERLIQLRKVDITQVACISAVAGAAISGGIIMRLLRPT